MWCFSFLMCMQCNVLLFSCRWYYRLMLILPLLKWWTTGECISKYVLKWLLIYTEHCIMLTWWCFFSLSVNIDFIILRKQEDRRLLRDCKSNVQINRQGTDSYVMFFNEVGPRLGQSEANSFMGSEVHGKGAFLIGLVLLLIDEQVRHELMCWFILLL